jgi:predicted O-methyltransferase YrrM
MESEIITYINCLNLDETLKKQYDQIIEFDSRYVIPAVRYNTALFLKWITNLKKPSLVLEIGFGSGVSSIFINHGNSAIKIISLERDKNRFLRGKNLLHEMKIENIELLNMDAFDYFTTNNISYDMIFLDSVKREYKDYLVPVKKILNKNGLLICDNILFNGKVIDKCLDKKYFNGVELLKEFNTIASNDLELDTFFIPIDDGILVSIKK